MKHGQDILFEDIVGYVIPREVMYLGSLNNYVPENDRYLTKMLLVTCKKAITRNGCNSEPPITTQWLEIIREVCRRSLCVKVGEMDAV